MRCSVFTRKVDELLAPIKRTLFSRNPGRLMQQWAEVVSRMLDPPLLSQENMDLKASITHA